MLIEFAIISMAFCMLFAGMISFGLILFKANITQQAADVGAQELSRMPLSPTNQISGDENNYLNDVLYGDLSHVADGTTKAAYQAVRDRIFDEQYLYVAADPPNSPNYQSLYAKSAGWPLLNRLLVPAMVFDASVGEYGVYRYPVRS